MGKLIEGNYKTDQKVIVIDEEISDPASTLQVLGRLEGSGLNIVGVFVLIDRGLDNLEAIRNKGYRCEALINLNDVFIRLFEMGKISPNQLNQTKDYFKTRKIASYL